MNPESDQQIGGEADQFPANEKKKQTVRDYKAEHRRGEKREIREESAEIPVVGHVADAEDKDAEADQCDHHQHCSAKWIEHPTDSKCIPAESKPGEILKCPPARGPRATV